MDVTVLLPMSKPDHALDRMLPALAAQVTDKTVEYLVIDNGFTGQTEQLIRKYLPAARIIRNPTPGLALSYNTGIRAATGEVIILMHQDIILPTTDCLQRIVAPLRDPAVVAAFPSLYLDPTTFQTYDFWHKVMFSTMANRPGRMIPTLSGKFDAFRRCDLLEAGLFDATTYRIAGEDVDLRIRLSQRGKIIDAGVRIEHIHGWNRHATLGGILRLEQRWGETAGVIMRRYLRAIAGHPGAFLGEISQLAKPAAVASLLLGFAHPVLVVPGLAAAFWYRWPTWRVLPSFALPAVFLNIVLFGLFTAGYVEGFFRGRQTR